MRQISLTVPTGLAAYASTVAAMSTVRGIPVDELIGWSVPVLITLMGLGLAIRSRRLLGGQRFILRLAALALLGVIPAAIDLDYSSDGLLGAAELVAVYSAALVLVLSLRSASRRAAGSSATAIAPAIAILAVATPKITSVDGAIALEALALVLLVTIGIIGCREVRSVQFSTDSSTLGRINLNSLRDSMVFWTGSALAVTLAYSLGNTSDLLSRESVALAEFATLRYPLAALATLLVATALVTPLACRGPWAAGRLVTAAAFGWAVLTQLPELTVAGIALPAGEVILAVLVCVVTIKKEPPAPDQSSPSSRLRTCLPRSNPAENAMLAIKIAAVLAIIPVGYFIYTTITSLPSSLRQPGPGTMFVVAGVLSELAGWILTGLIFAGLSTRLRGSVGPVRALVLSGAWFAAAFTVHVIDDWAQHSTGRGWSFPGLQLLLFLVTFSLIWDACVRQLVSG